MEHLGQRQRPPATGLTKVHLNGAARLPLPARDLGSLLHGVRDVAEVKQDSPAVAEGFSA